MSLERMKVITEDSAKDLPLDHLRSFIRSGNGPAAVGVLSRYAWEVDAAQVLKEMALLTFVWVAEVGGAG